MGGLCPIPESHPRLISYTIEPNGFIHYTVEKKKTPIYWLKEGAVALAGAKLTASDLFNTDEKREILRKAWQKFYSAPLHSHELNNLLHILDVALLMAYTK